MAELESLQVNDDRTGQNAISALKAEFIPQSKVKVSLELYEGNDRPNVAFLLSDSKGTLLARSYIISCIEQQMDFTLHIRQPGWESPLVLVCETFFEENQPIDKKEVVIHT